ncbi:MAG TPA: FHA domain-containing protein [Thermoanaerobaculia bacterium]|nr:FHA domain-containing protein [Thermoanaerobaculia bacterium]
MELIIRHLSGSRQGQEQVFDSQSVTLGRNPMNQITFDPDADILVSSRHAELVYESGSWMLRDLGSTNGTFVNQARVTAQRLKSGDILELGNGGPKLYVEFPQDLSAAGPGEMLVPEGRTVMMSMQQASASPPPLGMPKAGGGGPLGFSPMAGPSSPPPRKSNPLRVILLAAMSLMLLVLLAVLLLHKSGGGTQTASTSTVTMSTTNSASPATATTVPASAANVTPEQQKTMAEAEQLKTTIAQQQRSIKDVQQASSTAAPGSTQSQDMERQLRESQQMVEELQKQLQQKNDQVTEIQSRPPQVKTEVRYVRVPTPVAAASATPKAGAASSSTQGAAVQSQRPGQTVATPNQPAVQAAPSMALGELVIEKALKKKIKIQALPPEIPPANLPTGTPTELAAILGRAAASTGNYLVVDNRGAYSANITVTNYLNNERTNINTRSIARTVGAVGGLLGKTIPTNPVNVTSISSQTAMTTRLRIYDARGKQLFEAAQSADAAATRSRASLEGLPFNQVLASDSTAGDVARRVISQAVESLTSQLDPTEWSGEVSTQVDNVLTLDAGQSSKVEPGDVFEVVDRGRQVATAIVTQLDEDSSQAELVTGVGGKYARKNIRYLGRRAKDPSIYSKRAIQLLVRNKTKIYDGPGTSFKALKELRGGAKVKYLYSLGTWAKASDKSEQFWVPMIFAEVQM